MDDITKNLLNRMSSGEMYSEISDAVLSGDYDEVRSLLKEGKDVNWKDGFGISLLMYAAGSGHEKIVTLLLENGADKEMMDMNGLAAIDYASKKGHDKITEIINEFKKETTETSKSGCFIATTVYGSYNAHQVIILRDFRDKYLLNSTIGKLFIKIYYYISPSIANCISNKPFIKKILKKNILSQIINRVQKGKYI